MTFKIFMLFLAATQLPCYTVSAGKSSQNRSICDRKLNPNLGDGFGNSRSNDIDNFDSVEFCRLKLYRLAHRQGKPSAVFSSKKSTVTHLFKCKEVMKSVASLQVVGTCSWVLSFMTKAKDCQGHVGHKIVGSGQSSDRIPKGLRLECLRRVDLKK